MLSTLQEFFRNHLVQWMLALSVVLNGAQWATIAWFIRPTDAPILLRYNVYLGLDFGSLGSWYLAYSIPAMALFFLAVHTALSLFFFYRKDRIAAHISLLAAALLQVAGILSCAAISIVNR